MINKVLFVGAIALAAIGAATAPAFAGLSGNPSFSHSVPVRVPAQAQLVHFDDHGHAKSTAPTASVAPTPTAGTSTSTVRPSEPGDDRGTDATSRAPRSSDDHGGARPTTSTSPRSSEPGDDHGGHGEATEPGDDHGGKHGGHHEPGDDNGHGGGN